MLNITGTARLGGTLEVELIDGFVPNVGNMFQILTAGSVINTFESVIAFDSAKLVRPRCFGAVFGHRRRRAD